MAQAAEHRWWRRYLHGRPVGEYLGWKRGYWHDLLRQLGLAPKPGAHVLDAGCGPAGIFTALPQCAVTAVDPLLARYDALPHFQRADYPYVTWAEAPLETVDLPRGAFDYVFCLNVVNHVRDLGGVLRVLAQAARPDAPVVVSVDAHRHAWLKPLFRAVPGDVLHPHQHDLAEYRALLVAAGLTVVAEHLHRREALFDYWVITCRKAHQPA